MKKLTAEEWITYGLKQGWCGPPVCATHDGVPMTEDEGIEMEQHDPCITILRLYDDEMMRDEVEQNHSPSIWRKREFDLD